MAGTLIAATTVVWLLGAAPPVILFSHLYALLLTTYLFALSKVSNGMGQHIFATGFLSGIFGTLITEIFVHTANVPNLAAAFTAYASLGPILYRLNETLTWWPFTFVALNELGYGGMAFLISQALRTRQHPPLTSIKNRPQAGA